MATSSDADNAKLLLRDVLAVTQAHYDQLRTGNPIARTNFTRSLTPICDPHASKEQIMQLARKGMHGCDEMDTGKVNGPYLEIFRKGLLLNAAIERDKEGKDKDKALQKELSELWGLKWNPSRKSDSMSCRITACYKWLDVHKALIMCNAGGSPSLSFRVIGRSAKLRHAFTDIVDRDHVLKGFVNAESAWHSHITEQMTRHVDFLLHGCVLLPPPHYEDLENKQKEVLYDEAVNIAMGPVDNDEDIRMWACDDNAAVSAHAKTCSVAVLVHNDTCADAVVILRGSHEFTVCVGERILWTKPDATAPALTIEAPTCTMYRWTDEPHDATESSDAEEQFQSDTDGERMRTDVSEGQGASDPEIMQADEQNDARERSEEEGHFQSEQQAKRTRKRKTRSSATTASKDDPPVPSFVTKENAKVVSTSEDSTPEPPRKKKDMPIQVLIYSVLMK
jgi:hypothetical protein